MNQELEWAKVPLIMVSDIDRALARMILSGTPYNDEHKLTRGFLFYNIVEGDFVHVKHYDQFMKLLNVYITATWPNINDWDKQIEGKTISDLEWDPHLQAYKLLLMGNKIVQKIVES